MDNWFRGHGPHSFYTKFLCVLLSFVLLCLSFFGFFLTWKFRKALMQETRISAENRLASTAFNLETLLVSVQTNTTMLSLNQDIIRFARNDSQEITPEYLIQNHDAKKQLGNSMHTHEVLKSIYIVPCNSGHFLRTDMHRSYTRNELEGQLWYQSVCSVRKNRFILLPADTLTDFHPEATLSYVVPIWNFFDTQIDGYLVSNISFHLLFSIIENNLTGHNDEIFIFDGDSPIYSAGEPETAAAVLQQVEQNRRSEAGSPNGSFIQGEHLYTYHYSQALGWMYISRIPTQVVLEPSDNILRASLILLAITVPMILFFAAFLTSVLLRPFRILVSAMIKAGQGQYVRIREHRNDEFNEVFSSFNSMIEKLFHLMSNLRHQEALTKELKVKNLQAQLSPHFLYNTLDAIHWAARDNEMDTVCKMIFLLSDYFRKSLDDNNDLATVREVSEMIRSYMGILTLRFSGGFHYTMEVDPSVAEVRVPKHLFQPIVENALTHGIERTSREGYCTIRWEDCGEKLRFYVGDNGRGISPEELKHLYETLESGTGKESFALRNIQSQLTMYYGEKIHIRSVLGEGTEVWFCITKELGKGYVQITDCG